MGPTAEQKRIAKRLMVRWGPSSKRPFAIGESQPNPALAKTLRLPRPTREHFAEYRTETAKGWVAKHRHLVGKPVILTGGGGAGLRWAFLEKLKAEPAERFPEGHGIDNPVRLKDKASIVAHLVPFPNEAFFFGGEEGKPFSPHLGSWKLSELTEGA